MNGQSLGTVSESKERVEGALQINNAGPSLRWEHKVELWKHPKVSDTDIGNWSTRHSMHCTCLSRRSSGVVEGIKVCV